MLRKRSRSQQKAQNMVHPTSDSSESFTNVDAVLKQKHKTNSFFNVSGLFVGLNPKGSESDSVRSPTSPLDFRIFSKSSLGNSFRSGKPPSDGGNQKSWECNKVGLSIIDSLQDEPEERVRVVRASDSKSILFGPQMRIKNPNLVSFEATNSLPKNFGIDYIAQIKSSDPKMSNASAMFGIGDAPLGTEAFDKVWSHSLDSASLGSHLSDFAARSGSSILSKSSASKLNSVPIPTESGKDLVACLSASEIELSEEYTCVKIHGPNPKITHIFGDCILECHNNEFIVSSVNKEQEAALSLAGECSEVAPSYPCDDFLSSCFSCKKKLDGEDIYMYRGEKAFCSWECREQEISIQEKMENTNNDSSKATPKSNSREELFETSMFIATA